MPQAMDIGVDLGTANVVIYGKNKGIVLNEPAIIAMDRDTHMVKAVGREARRMLGRTPGNLVVIRPLQTGAMPDFDATATMLHYFVSSVIGKHRLLTGPKVVMTLPGGINEVEARHLTGSLFEAGAKRTQLLEKPIAAAIGADMHIDGTYGSMVVDIGGGLTEIAVISAGRCVMRERIDIAGDKLNEAIIRFVRRKYNFLIGETTAEELKVNIGSAVRRDIPLFMEVTGRDLLTGLPKLLRIDSDDITEAIEEPLQAMVERIHGVLEGTPAELANDIFDSGIVLTGGGALLSLLGETVTDMLKVDCRVAERAQETAAIGCGMALEHWSDYSQYLSVARARR